MKKIIEKFTLDNAVKHGGKANPKAVLGKVLQEDPKLKTQMRELKKEIDRLVKKINKLSVDEQKSELKKIAPELLEKKEAKKKGLPELRHRKKRVVMRFEPSPSGPLHVGHAYVFGLNSEYCKEYKGKLILRIADTNAGNIYVPSYDMLPEDAEWLTNGRIDEVIVQSDHLELYYEHALELLEMGAAYICTCSGDDFRKYVNKKMPCPCRENPEEKNVKLWHMMFDPKKFKEGDAVMRLKTDIKHKNPAMRDFPLFRINDDEHPKKGKKYRVWPLMNFSVTIDDHDSGVTHILRAKDHADNAKRQEYIYNYFKWDIPETIFVGRINFIGLNVSCSKTKPLIENGTYTGWDDIRLPFIPALKRRGYQPEAFTRYALEIGVSLNDKTVSKEEFFKTLNAFNREIIEEKANRYFFVEEPSKIIIENAPSLTVELHLHPTLRREGRPFKTNGEFYIQDKLEEGKLYRLMDCLNFEYKKGKCVFHSTEYKEVRGKAKMIHWLPVAADLVQIKVLMEDGKLKKGLAEPLAKDLEEGTIVQFERFGFCRLDDKEDMMFWFLHR